MRLDLLRVEPDVVRRLEQTLHLGDGLGHAARPGEASREPERAPEERALLGLVEPVVAAVARDERADREVAAHRVDRRLHALSRAFLALQDREGQQPGVELAQVGRADEALELLVPAAGLDEVPRTLRRLIPAAAAV